MAKVSKKGILILVVATLSLFVVYLFSQLNQPPLSLKLGSYFSSIPIEIENYDIFDLGVADVNNDKNLDIFTLNHSSRQSLSLGDGEGNFSKSLSKLALSQDRQFPNLENSDDRPVFDTPGLYIYRQYNVLNLVAKNTEDLGSIDGTLKLSIPIEVVQMKSARVESEEDESRVGEASQIEFSLDPNGILKIRAFDNIIEIPHKIQLSNNIPLTSIFVGLEKTNPNSHAFDLMWRDRHNMAWADLNSDGQVDVFVGRGAAKGIMNDLPESFYDELFFNTGDRFEDRGQGSGLLKNDCAARQAAWIDYDRDGILDLYQVCSRGSNQLFKQQDNGALVDIAADVNLDLPGNGSFLWLDADEDGDLDLLWTVARDLSIYFNKNGKFEPEPIGRVGGGETQYTVADYDNDGDFDIYISSSDRGYLVQKTDQSYILTNPDSIGLPSQGLCASWVDYDNDGLVDLHAIPTGIYRQLPDRTFEPTKLLSERAKLKPDFRSKFLGSGQVVSRARCSWFDFDHDGYRDLLVSQMRTSSVIQRLWSKLMTGDESSLGREWQTNLFKNNGNGSHWLEVELEGGDAISQDLAAIVTVESSESVQMQQVGNSEGSRFSQGHHRLYFGIGDREMIDSVTVKWSDGETQSLNNTFSDQLIIIKHP